MKHGSTSIFLLLFFTMLASDSRENGQFEHPERLCCVWYVQQAPINLSTMVLMCLTSLTKFLNTKCNGVCIFAASLSRRHVPHSASCSGTRGRFKVRGEKKLKGSRMEYVVTGTVTEIWSLLTSTDNRRSS